MDPFANQLKQVALTYLTDRWIKIGILAEMTLIVAPLLVMNASNALSTGCLALISLPAPFLSLILVSQANVQFAHARARLIPGFAAPHVAVLTGLLLFFVLLCPVAVASCLQLDRLGFVALTIAIAAPTILAAHFSRRSLMIVSLVAYSSSLTDSGANWWLLHTESHRAWLAIIVLAGWAMIAAWLARLCQLREEMDGYQGAVQWLASRNPDRKTSEQSRLVVAQLRHDRFASWMNDARLNRLPVYRDGGLIHVARLLRFGFGTQAEVFGLFMGIWMAALTIFMAKFDLLSSGPTEKQFVAVRFYLWMGVIGSLIFADTRLAPRRPRYGIELLWPLARGQFVDGHLAATASQWAAYWAVLNIGLVAVAWVTLQDRLAVPVVVAESLVSAAALFAICATSMWTAVWPSRPERTWALRLSAAIFSLPVFMWNDLHGTWGNLPAAAAAVVSIIVAVLLVQLARKAWRIAEFG